jgi:tungstate transport system ATP-binding protein
MRLELNNICQRYGEEDLFVIDQLQLISTDAVHLHGPNGVGKSTLMKIMAGLQKPTSGELSLGKSPSIRPSISLA